MAGYEPGDIEDAIIAHHGPIGSTRGTKRPMIRAMTSDGEEIVIVFEMEHSGDFLLIRPVTAFPNEG